MVVVGMCCRGHTVTEAGGIQEREKPKRYRRGSRLQRDEDRKKNPDYPLLASETLRNTCAQVGAILSVTSDD